MHHERVPLEQQQMVDKLEAAAADAAPAGAAADEASKTVGSELMPSHHHLVSLRVRSLNALAQSLGFALFALQEPCAH